MEYKKNYQYLSIASRVLCNFLLILQKFFQGHISSSSYFETIWMYIYFFLMKNYALSSRQKKNIGPPMSYPQ